MSRERYTPEQLAAIRARYPSEGAERLASELGRTVSAIRSSAERLGVVIIRGDRHIYTAAEDDAIRRAWAGISLRKRGTITTAQLAKKLGLTVHQVRWRAAEIGAGRVAGPRQFWAKEEIDIIKNNVHISVSALRQRLAKAGYTRSENAIANLRYKCGSRVNYSGAAYSVNELTALIGMSSTSINLWIKRGWLKAEARNPDARDRMLIYPRDVRKFIRTYTAHITLSFADKFWLVDLLSGDEPEAGYLRQDRCGIRHEAASGYEEHGVAA